jgi:hypothetical protein
LDHDLGLSDFTHVATTVNPLENEPVREWRYKTDTINMHVREVDAIILVDYR